MGLSLIFVIVVGRCVREVSALPVANFCSSVGEDTETSSTTTESSHDDGDKVQLRVLYKVIFCGIAHNIWCID